MAARREDAAGVCRCIRAAPDDQSPNCDWDAHGDAVVKNKGPVGVIYVRVKSL